MKKFVIVIFIILIAAAAAAGWYVFFYTSSDEGGRAATSTGGGERTFFPLGLFGGNTLETEITEDGGEASDIGGVFIPPIRQVASEPVAAAIFTERNSEEALRYIDRATGHIFDAHTTSTAVTLVTNTTVPRVQRAAWIDERHPLVQYIDRDTDTVETFVGNIHEPTGTSTEGFLTGDFLAQDILAVTTHPESGIFSLLDTENGSVGNVTSLDGTTEEIFSSPLREWVPQWGPDGIIGMTTKPSWDAPGYLFLLSSSGSFSKTLSGLRGLTTNMNPRERVVLFASSNDGMLLKRLALDTDTIQDSSVYTLPEKCAWSTSAPPIIYCGVPETIPARMPDVWYQGRVTLSDALWQIDTATGAAYFIAGTDIFGEEIDIVSPILNERGDEFSFINKKDGSLWLVRLREVF